METQACGTTHSNICHIRVLKKLSRPFWDSPPGKISLRPLVSLLVTKRMNIMKSDFSETKNNIKEFEFLNSENIIELNIPEGFEAIGVGAFKNCEKLTKVTMPKGLKTIGDEAFY